MKFVTVRDFRTTPAAIWRDLKTEFELVITNNGKPIALITPLAEDNMEEMLRAVRKARADEALRSMRTAAIAANIDSLSIDEIDREIKKHRADK